ncbi:trans-2-enoyl-CoA reductase family protein [Clostridium sp. YIM B02505]|uniref:Trans-2-enoyl-CoA reductase [NADH] n=1 Tax=Clostridium yunnanense TaxID=2800325 RepID=A0ABS1EJW3_9CLOT|nr:enoyl-ACP reductase FabV [Clostridium yunnanense]MBK1809656.1 trans-2-enoyl-CoA reductase family protein [Clostridium yunnanense]
MIIKPKFRDYICLTAHPEGCAINVREQVEYIKKQKNITGPKNVLILGASTGYGLASRIAMAFGAKANTIGVVFERPAAKTRTASAGWYNTAEFERLAKQDSLYSKTINGDAFSNDVKEKAIELIRNDLGKIDLIIYSIASPRRTDPITGQIYQSTLKPIGEAYTNKAVNFHTDIIQEVTISPASEDEVESTRKVMGGEDWELWIKALSEAGVLAEGASTVAYTYVGSELTYPIYRNGTIGEAKKHLEKTSDGLNKYLSSIGGKAYISSNKALVTQSSSAIPVVPLYIALLFKIMKDKNIDESCIEQIYRLMDSKLYSGNKLDESEMIRLDDLELREDVQKEVLIQWDKISSENIRELTDIEGFRNEFFKLFGFGHQELNYDIDIDPNIDIPNLVQI